MAHPSLMRYPQRRFMRMEGVTIASPFAGPNTSQPGACPLPLRQPNQKIVVAAVFVCGMFMSSLDSTAVNVALATLSRQFHVPTASIDAVVIGYLVSLAVFIPASGWLGDRFGTKRVFLLALALFTG